MASARDAFIFSFPLPPYDTKGSLSKDVLSEVRQPEVDFLQPWEVVWFKLSGKSSLQEKRHLEI